MRDLGISLVLLGLAMVLLVAYGYRALLYGRARHERTDADGGSVFLNKATMEMFYWLLNPVVALLAIMRISPNMVTLFSLAPALGAAIALGVGWFGLAAALSILSAFCDILDGLLARRLGIGSDAGEVIDAAADRYGEFLFFFGLVYHYRTHERVLLLVLVAVMAAFMVSYATAKAEAMAVLAPRGAMRRSERVTYLIVGAALTPIAKTLFVGSPSLVLRKSTTILATTVVAMVGNISALQRLASVVASLRAREPAEIATQYKGLAPHSLPESIKPRAPVQARAVIGQEPSRPVDLTSEVRFTQP